MCNNELHSKRKYYVLIIKDEHNKIRTFKFWSKLELEKALRLRVPEFTYGNDTNNDRISISNFDIILDIYKKQEFNIENCTDDVVIN